MATFIVLTREGNETGPILDEDGKGNDVENVQVLGYARYGDGPAWQISQKEGITYQLVTTRAFINWMNDEEGQRAIADGFNEVMLQELQYDSYFDLQQTEYLNG